jgi:hypothetical protein
MREREREREREKKKKKKKKTLKSKSLFLSESLECLGVMLIHGAEVTRDPVRPKWFSVATKSRKQVLQLPLSTPDDQATSEIEAWTEVINKVSKKHYERQFF